MKAAFDTAKAAGKVRFFGVSTHENADAVLRAMIDTGWYDLAMIAITPAGWYDWNSRDILAQTPSMVDLKPLLDQAHEAGIGLVGMKAGRLLAGRTFLGSAEPQAFDQHYDERPAQGESVALPAQLRLRARTRHGRGERRHPELCDPAGELRGGSHLARDGRGGLGASA